MNNEVRPRLNGKGTEFGEAHRKLPPSICFTDIDSMVGIDNGLLKQLANEDETFVEYRTPYSGCVFTAVFDLKVSGSPRLAEALACKKGGSTWAQFLMSRRLGSRMFIVETQKGKPPFKFYEVVNEGDCRERGVLDYIDEDRTHKINEFWIKLNLLTAEEATRQLSKLHEVDVCYLKNGNYDSRKFARYETFAEADKVYKSTVAKFISEKTSALITLRSMNGVLWSLIKSELL